MSVLEQPSDVAEVAPGVSVLETSPTSERSMHSDLAVDGPRVTETEMIAPDDAVASMPLAERLQIRRFERITAIAGMIFLIAGLAVWRFKPHSDDRLALLIFVCAMFLAILHHYSLEENRRSGRRAAESS